MNRRLKHKLGAQILGATSILKMILIAFYSMRVLFRIAIAPPARLL